MFKLSPDKFLNLMFDNKHKVFVGGLYNLNIVGFRNKYGRPNQFDDTIAVYYKNYEGWESRFYKATTLPGTPSLLNPINKNGTAILVPGQYESCYQLGAHKGKYKALIQARQVRVYRDNNKDTVYDTAERSIESGLFGINIHKASLFSKVVGANSAGCQVIQDSKDYEEFISLCEKAEKVWGNLFSYTLVEI